MEFEVGAVTGAAESEKGPARRAQRNALAHAVRSGRHVVSAFIVTAFAQDRVEASSTPWRAVADQVRPEVPRARHADGRRRT